MKESNWEMQDAGEGREDSNKLADRGQREEHHPGRDDLIEMSLSSNIFQYPNVFLYFFWWKIKFYMGIKQEYLDSNF